MHLCTSAAVPAPPPPPPPLVAKHLVQDALLLALVVSLVARGNRGAGCPAYIPGGGGGEGVSAAGVSAAGAGAGLT